MKPISKKQNIVVQELEKELLVYDLQTNKAFALNETSAMVFGLCDGTKTVSEIGDSMSRKLKTQVGGDFVWLALNELKRDGLLETNYEMDRYFSGISRREIINKAALASMIALPFIISVTAPKAVTAQSCINPANCTFDDNNQGDCCPGFRCSTSRINPVIPECINCQVTGRPYANCGALGGCANCDTSSRKNTCCNASAPSTNDGTLCLCG